MPSETEIAALTAHVNEQVKSASDRLPWADPVKAVQWIHHTRIVANDWNPNSVANQEMRLLYTSINSDLYTQPIVAMFDHERGLFVVVDGFHRWTVLKTYPDIMAKTHGYLPVVVLDKPVADRIASTVRHNRARGKHSVAGMGSLVFQMLKEGESDGSVCAKLGLEAEELARLKHITGYSKLYADEQYSRPTLTGTQMKIKAAYAKEHPDERVPSF